jgi:hypothetical protein
VLSRYIRRISAWCAAISWFMQTSPPTSASALAAGMADTPTPVMPRGAPVLADGGPASAATPTDVAAIHILCCAAITSTSCRTPRSASFCRTRITLHPRRGAAQCERNGIETGGKPGRYSGVRAPR